MRFSDAAAHRMALMAMGQFGIALAALSAAYTLAASRDELDGILRAGRIPIWLPEKMALDATSVPASWEVTSDSLAAWLAGVYGARRLLLIKSRDVAAPISALELADAQIVDPAFPRFAAKSKAEVWLAGPASLEGAVPVLQGGSMPGISVAVEEHGLGV
jgi:dihydroneopterin aldolase